MNERGEVVGRPTENSRTVLAEDGTFQTTFFDHRLETRTLTSTGAGGRDAGQLAHRQTFSYDERGSCREPMFRGGSSLMISPDEWEQRLLRELREPPRREFREAMAPSFHVEEVQFDGFLPRY